MGDKPWKPRREEVAIAISVGICLLLRPVPNFQAVIGAGSCIDGRRSEISTD